MITFDEMMESDNPMELFDEVNEGLDEIMKIGGLTDEQLQVLINKDLSLSYKLKGCNINKKTGLIVDNFRI